MSMIAPGSTIGILGGGQLGRMIASAANQLGFDVHIFCPEDDAPASRAARQTWIADYSDDVALRAFAKSCDVVTLEFENIPASTAKAIADCGVALHPGPKALAISQDRAEEKAFLNSIDIPTAPYEIISAAADIPGALERVGGTGVLKTRRDGYDGKGQSWVRSSGDADIAWDAIGAAPAILEAAIPFECEISVIVARSSVGETLSWAPPRNAHVDGILSRSIVPSGLDKNVETRAREQAMKLVEALDYVGVLALEFFVLSDGSLLANEFAPRVHNSGHWTPEACQTGQFEQHIRAISGWPLGDTRRLFDAEMRNLIGDQGLVDPTSLKPDETLTLYGKRDARPGRKMGHITRRIAPRKD